MNAKTNMRQVSQSKKELLMRVGTILISLAAIASLVGCGRSEEDIRKDERAKIEAERAAQQKSVAAAQPETPQPTPPAVAPPPPALPKVEPWAGRYDMSGGGEGDVEIAPIKGSTDRYRVSFAIGQKGCMGNVEGTAVETKSGALTFTGPPSEDFDGTPRVCTIELARKNGRSVSVNEIEGCTNWHGAACEFTGTMTRK
jgi:hypothetical protein